MNNWKAEACDPFVAECSIQLRVQLPQPGARGDGISTGRDDIVNRVEHANNNVRVTQLGADTALASWLDPPLTMAIGAGVSAVVLVAVRLLSPAAFTLDPDDYRT